MKWIAVSFAFLLAACSVAQQAPDLSTAFSAQASPDLISTSQPSGDDLKALKAAGYRLVVNLRNESEFGRVTKAGMSNVAYYDEPSAAQALGLAYVNLAIVKPEDLTMDNVRALAEILASAEGPVALHCSSGNRAGAILAMRAFWIEGRPADEALAVGKKAGLTSWEGSVRQLLGLPPLS